MIREEDDLRGKKDSKTKASKRRGDICFTIIPHSVREGLSTCDEMVPS